MNNRRDTIIPIILWMSMDFHRPYTAPYFRELYTIVPKSGEYFFSPFSLVLGPLAIR